MTGHGELLRSLVDDLAGRGVLTPQWRSEFLSVPRHLFIPDTVWETDEDTDAVNDLVPLHRTDDPQRWLELAYRNRSLVTQVDDGHLPGPGLAGFEATSSASMPSIVAVMLAALDVRDGHRVLEVGTGTGYNAALLAHRAGAQNVTTIEIDAYLADRARAALSDAGLAGVAVVTGDGSAGCPVRGPYDRIISTAACQHVPYPWIAQTRPGGRVLTPWANPYFDGGLLSLTVTADGTASGRIVDKSFFMWLREQRVPRGVFAELVHDVGEATTMTTDVHPYGVGGDYDAQLAISLRVPRCRHLYSPYDEDRGEGIVWFLDPWSRSWASLHHTTADASDEQYTIRQLGPRRLWDEVDAAYRWWREAGSPAADRWLFTVTPDGDHVELDGTHSRQ
jgi:protein-L-isoaspartate(D-aspartate) O-methyltransferase